MQISISFPTRTQIQRFLNIESGLDYSYRELGATQQEPPRDYDHDHSSIYLGRGAELWSQAKTILDTWQQFPADWTNIQPTQAPLEVNQNVAVLFRLWGIWFTNSARIVYVLREENRYGFAYGTLPGHVEQGEECFWIEREANGAIYYHIKAFSKPRFWLAKLGYPIARMYQRKFVKESLNRFVALTTSALDENHSQTVPRSVNAQDLPKNQKKIKHKNIKL